MDEVGVIQLQVNRKVHRYDRTIDRHVRRIDINGDPGRSRALTNNIDVSLPFDHRLVKRKHKVAVQGNIIRTIQGADAQNVQRHQFASFQLLDELFSKLLLSDGFSIR